MGKTDILAKVYEQNASSLEKTNKKPPRSSKVLWFSISTKPLIAEVVEHYGFMFREDNGFVKIGFT